MKTIKNLISGVSEKVVFEGFEIKETSGFSLYEGALVSLKNGVGVIVSEYTDEDEKVTDGNAFVQIYREEKPGNYDETGVISFITSLDSPAYSLIIEAIKTVVK